MWCGCSTCVMYSLPHHSDISQIVLNFGVECIDCRMSRMKNKCLIWAKHGVPVNLLKSVAVGFIKTLVSDLTQYFCINLGSVPLTNTLRLVQRAFLSFSLIILVHERKREEYLNRKHGIEAFAIALVNFDPTITSYHYLCDPFARFRLIQFLFSFLH